MKNLKKYIYGALAVVFAAVMPSCQDDFDEPTAGGEIPVATMEANTTLLQLKEWMWDDSNNYCDTVFTVEWYNTPEAERTEAMKTEGTHVIVKGRVVSSDYAGNCFKYVVLQDETAALNFSINSYNLYLYYRVGQEIVIDLTGLHAGKYRGLEQVGFPSYNSSIPGYETSFMAPELFSRHLQLNGRPDVSKVDTTVVERFSDLGVTPAELRKWQSRLVRFNNVEFVANATTPTLSTYHSSGVTQQITDAEGNTLDIRTSGYANFWNNELPEGKCDVVALLGYYVNLAGTGGWQLTLIDINSIMNVGNPTVPKGSETNPYSVLEAIAYQVNSENHNGWVKGYIVGTVGPEVETISSSNDIEWGADATLRNTLVIGQTPDTKDIAECLVISLPQGSDLQKYGALRENPDNLGKEIVIRGTFAKYMGTYGLTDNSGSASEFRIEGIDLGPVEPEKGDGTEDKPYTVAQVLALGNPGTTAWVTGYIVGVINYDNNSSLETTVPTTVATCVAIAASTDETDKNKCVAVQLPAGDIRSAVNLKDHPENLGKVITLQGSLEKYFGIAGVKSVTAYKMDGSDNTPGATGTPEGDGTLASPYNATAALAIAKALSVNDKQNAYVKGKIASITEIDTSYGNATYTITDGAANLSVYRGYYIDGAKFTSTDQLKVGDEVVIVGDLVNYMGNTPQFTSGSKIVSHNGSGSGSGDGDTPAVEDNTKGNFSTFNGGSPNSKYGTYTNATGWEGVNVNILSGLAAGATEQNPRFAFIGDASTLAVCLNGNATTPGTLTSPVIKGGVKKLTYNYGFAYSDTKCQYKIQFIQNNEVVKEEVVKLESFTTKTAYDYSLDVNITGDVQIKFVNLALSGKTKNSDRIAIWNLTWE